MISTASTESHEGQTLLYTFTQEFRKSDIYWQLLKVKELITYYLDHFNNNFNVIAL